MSEQEPYGQQPYGQQSYEPQSYSAVAAPPPPGYGYPPPQLQPQKTNTMSILGLIFAFIFSPLGLIFSIVGLSQTKRRGEGGRGLAIAGLIISIISLIIGILMIVVVATAASTAIKNAGGIDALASKASAASAAAKADDKGVAKACHIIIPAASNSDLGNATSVKDYQAKIGALVQTMQSAAASTTDPTFIADVQKLVDDFNSASATVGKGGDPSSLEGALTADGTKIDQDCAAVGVSG